MFSENTIDHKNQEYKELSLMFFSDDKDPTFGIECLQSELLDYSVESLEHINNYLLRIKKLPDITKNWNKTILRCGAYVGEVIRATSKNKPFYWYDYKDAIKFNNSKLNNLKYQIGTAGILYRKSNFFCFPLAKVEKFLDHGLEHNLKFFVKEILKTG